VHINGEDKDLEEGLSVADVVASLGLAGRRVAIEYNREILRSSDWAATRLRENDALEIVHFVGGG